ncbi:MAG: sugar transferase [Gemmatimonadales bacterium]
MTSTLAAASRHQHIDTSTATVATPTQRAWIHLARSTARIAALVGFDALALLGLLALVRGVRDHYWLGTTPAAILGRLIPAGVLSPGQLIGAVLLCLVLFNGYGETSRGQHARRRFAGVGLGIGLPYWAQIWTEFRLDDLTAFVLLVSAAAILLIAQRHLVERAVRLLMPAGLGVARVLLIASWHDLRRHPVQAALANGGDAVIAGVFNPEILRRRNGGTEELAESIRDTGADTVVLCCGPMSDGTLSEVRDAAVASGCRLASLSRSSIALAAPGLSLSCGVPVVVLTQPDLRAAKLLCKRAIDVVGALAGLLAVAPIMILVALAIKFERSGPILFGQWRVGTGGKAFRCYKFRSMRVDAEDLLRRDPELHRTYVQNNFKLPEGRDPRITPLGRFLRVSSLDELPQLWNVLCGDMSLVGPRPVVPDELAEYGDRTTLLLSLRPGMAGEWAVSGRSRVGYPERAKMELGYVRSWRLGLDLSILARVVPAVFKRRGAH